MFRDRVARHYRLSHCIVLFIPSLPGTDKDAGKLPVLQQASMPRQRLRSIPKESATQRLGINLGELVDDCLDCLAKMPSDV